MRSCLPRVRPGARTLLLMTALAPLPAAAQFDAQAGFGGTYESYVFAEPETVGIESITLVTLPFAAEAFVARRVTLGLSGALATATLTRADGGESSLDGLTDTELRATVTAADGRLSLTGLVLLPTGTSTLGPEEVEVAGALAADLLPFRISNWGTGGGMALSAAVAQPFGASSVGFSVGYRLANEFEPLEGGVAAYRPGNELRVRVAMDRSLGNGGKFSLQGTVFTYGEDRFEGTNLYRSGDRYQGVASYAAPLGSGSAVFYTGILHRAESDANEDDPPLTGAFRPTPSQTLLMFGGAGRMAMGAVRLLPMVDVRLIRREDGAGQGWIAGAGTALEWPGGSNRTATLVPSLRLRYGTLMVMDGVESPVRAVDLGLSLRLGEVGR